MVSLTLAAHFLIFQQSGIYIFFKSHNIATVGKASL